MAISSEPATLDPRYATDAVGQRMISLMFNSLIRLGPNFEPVPEAAESWTQKGTLFTFKLRRDLVFHNGRPLNRDDVDFSLAQISTPGSAFAPMRDLVKHIGTRVENGQILVEIELKAISDKFLHGELRGLKLIPKAETLAAGQDFAHHLIGTGGYRLVRQDLNEIEFAAVSAATPHLIFKIIHDDFTRYQKLLKGEVDIAQMELTPDRVANFRERPDEFNVFLYPGLSMTYVLMNFKNPLLAKLAVRQALASSLNVEEMIKYKLSGLAQPATSIMTPQNPYFDEELKPVAFDLARAKQLIHDAGAAGQELTLKTSNSPSSVDTGKVLAHEMSETGLKVRLQSYEWGTFYGDVKRGDFQMATMKWVGTVDPDIYRMAFLSTEKPPGRNRGSYNNPRLDALLESGGDEPSVEKRRRIFNQVQEIVHQDLAIIPLWYEEQIAIAKKTVINYHPNYTGDYWPLLEAHKTQ